MRCRLCREPTAAGAISYVVQSTWCNPKATKGGDGGNVAARPKTPPRRRAATRRRWRPHGRKTKDTA
eukprot:9471179-Pyramimonas_sp.AAC.1